MTDRQHRYRIGEMVELMPNTLRSAAPGRYEIVQLVPCDARDPQYRLKSLAEKHERVVPECDLVPAPDTLRG